MTIDEAWKDKVYSYGGIALPKFPNLFMLYGPFSPVNNVPVPMGLDQEIAFIMSLIELSRRRRVTVEPTVAATENFLARIRAALPDTVSVAARDWYSGDQGTPILWPLSQDAHKEFFGQIAEEEFNLVPTGQAEPHHSKGRRSTCGPRPEPVSVGPITR